MRIVWISFYTSKSFSLGMQYRSRCFQLCLPKDICFKGSSDIQKCWALTHGSKQRTRNVGCATSWPTLCSFGITKSKQMKKWGSYTISSQQRYPWSGSSSILIQSQWLMARSIEWFLLTNSFSALRQNINLRNYRLEHAITKWNLNMQSYWKRRWKKISRRASKSIQLTGIRYNW